MDFPEVGWPKIWAWVMLGSDRAVGLLWQQIAPIGLFQ